MVLMVCQWSTFLSENNCLSLELKKKKKRFQQNTLVHPQENFTNSKFRYSKKIVHLKEMHWNRCDHESVHKPSPTEWRVMCTFSEKSRYLCMFKKADTKTPSTEGKWYESEARLAVFGEVISRLSHFKHTSIKLLLTRLQPWMAVVPCCTEEELVSHMRRQRLRHKPPHAHTAVYHSVPTIWSALKGSLWKCSLSLFALIQVLTSSFLFFFQCTPSSLMHVNPTNPIVIQLPLLI